MLVCRESLLILRVIDLQHRFQFDCMLMLTSCQTVLHNMTYLDVRVTHQNSIRPANLDCFDHLLPFQSLLSSGEG